MSSITPDDCFTAQISPNILENGPMDPDVGGFAVGLANIAINILLSILLRWSKDDVLSSVYGLYSQVYPILLATAASINRSKLSLFEAHFAVAISASPVCLYLVCLAFRDAYRNRSLFHNVMNDTGNVFARWLGLILPFLWLTLNAIISFSSTSFKNSHLCRGVTVKSWLEFQIVSNFLGVLDVMGRRDLWNDLSNRGGLGAISVGVLWIWGVYFVRHYNDIWEQFGERKKEYHHRVFYLRWPTHALRFGKISWHKIAVSHPWLILVMICCFHWNWILGIMKGISFNHYEFSYGQALSVFSVIPPLIAVIKLVIVHYNVYKVRAKGIPTGESPWWSACKREIIFFFTGKSPSLLRTRRMNQGIVGTIPCESSNPRWWTTPFLHLIVYGCMSLLLSALDAVYIVNYVITGSIPNPKTIVNSPHKNWKPFSIGVYIGGFLISCFNVFTWSRYYEIVVGWFVATKVSRARYSIFWLTHITIIFPITTFMCLGPLFAPFAALPLSQEFQWSHHCDSYPGEAILEGHSYDSKPSILSLYYSQTQDLKTKYFERALSQIPQSSNDTGLWVLSLQKSPSHIKFHRDVPLVDILSYDVDKNTMSAWCTESGEDHAKLCMQGSFIRNSTLSFAYNSMHIHTETKLRAVDRQWSYEDDAPSFTLHRVQEDDKLGDLVMQTAVTKRNNCQSLKVCLLPGIPGLDVLAPLGLALWAQDRYATYCKKPGIYS